MFDSKVISIFSRVLLLLLLLLFTLLVVVVVVVCSQRVSCGFHESKSSQIHRTLFMIVTNHSNGVVCDNLEKVSVYFYT